jgi:hypothetical protein
MRSRVDSDWSSMYFDVIRGCITRCS